MSAQGVRVGVVGCGYWGRNLVRNFAELGVLACISDSDPKTASAMTSQYGIASVPFEHLLADPSVSAVAIGAPAVLHAELARAALLAGKHVFVEKPLALRVGDAEKLCELAEARRLTLMVGHLLQYHPAFIKLHELVREGALGRVRYFYSNRLNLGKVRREEDILWSFAPHDLSMILTLAGEIPEAISAKAGYFLQDRIADVTVTHLGFPSGQQAHVFVSWLHPFKEQKLVVVGDKAMAVFDDGETWQRKLLLYPHRIEWRDEAPVPHRAEAISVPVEEGEPLRLECQHFIDCVATGSMPRTDGREGVRVLRVLERATEVLRAAPSPLPQPAPAPSPPTARFPDVMIHESAYVDEPCEIGAGSRLWHFVHVLPRTRIGRGCSLGQNVMVGPDVTVGDGCKIQNNVSLYKGVTLENDVFCGPSSVFTNVNNPRADVERKDEFRPTLVKKGASIGANATIVCGHTVGAFAFIAAGAVVTSNVPDFALMAGVPARRIGWMSKAGERLGPDLVCPRSGRKYRTVEADKLEEIA